MEKVSVEQALNKGHWRLTYPSMLILFVGLGLTLFLVIVFKKTWIFFVGFLFSFGLSWLWWSVKVTKWRIWAFGNCRNVHELKRKAINEYLIHAEGGLFEKTEMRSKLQERRLVEIADKFKLDDILEPIEDDSSIPEETKIYFSKVLISLYWFGGIGLLCFGIYLIFESDNFGYLMILFSCYPFYHGYKKSSIKDPYILLNSKGIKILNKSFIVWEDLKRIETHRVGAGKQSKMMLQIIFHNEEQSALDVEIDELDKSYKEINFLIKLYRNRNLKKSDSNLKKY